MKRPISKPSLRTCNNLLLISILIINGYSLLLPLWPSVQYWVKKHFTSEQQKLSQLAATNSSSHAVTRESRLVIPDMLLNEPIVEGQSANTVDKGVWRAPYGSSPDKGGNTVLIGHRFTYRGPAVFYHLDLLRPNQRFSVFWQGNKYVYKVKTITVVGPRDTSIEAPTAEPVITLYTCTPMWTVKQRLVVRAERINP